MTAIEPVSNLDLDLDRDLPFQRHQWTAQRAGWLIMTAIIVAALLGLFGSGPLSSATAEAGPLQLQYSRFERRYAPSELEVSIPRPAIRQDQVEVWITTGFLDRVEISSIVPEPEEVSETDERVVYRFSIDDLTDTPMIHVALEYDDPGVTTGRLGIIDGPQLTFWQFVYP